LCRRLLVNRLPISVPIKVKIARCGQTFRPNGQMLP
jgi:hypothetical protein